MLTLIHTTCVWTHGKDVHVYIHAHVHVHVYIHAHAHVHVHVYVYTTIVQHTVETSV